MDLSLKAGKMPSTSDIEAPALFDAGVFIGALLSGDPRHTEARSLVEAGRRGEIQVCTTPSILSEVYGALTWEKAQPCHAPQEAAEAVQLLVEAPSAIKVLDEGYEAALRALELAANHNLKARRIHDARHAATALVAGVCCIYTYDIKDWVPFETDGLLIVGPTSTLVQLKRPTRPTAI
jgi:predicted nucleic acid-binding protein